MEQSARRQDLADRFVSDLKLTCLPSPFSDYFLDWTLASLSSGPSSILYYWGNFKNSRLID